MSTVPGLREMIAEPEREKIKTAVQETRDHDDKEQKKNKNKDKKKEDEEKGESDTTTTATTKREWPTAYDGKKREPEFANAQNSCLWELASFFFLSFLSLSLSLPFSARNIPPLPCFLTLPLSPHSRSLCSDSSRDALAPDRGVVRRVDPDVLAVAGVGRPRATLAQHVPRPVHLPRTEKVGPGERFLDDAVGTRRAGPIGSGRQGQRERGEQGRGTRQL